MKLSVKFTPLTAMILIVNLASGSENIGVPIAVVAQRPTVTPNVQGHVKHKRIVKSKVQRAQPFGMDDNDDDVVQNDDLATGYRRRDLNKIERKDIELSDYVKIRLMIARMKAMEAYRKAQA